MDANLLARLEELERKATPRPWIHDVDTREDGADHLLAFGGELTVAFMPTPQEEHEYDAMLIVELRNAAPVLLRVARAARVHAQHETVEGWMDTLGELRAALAALDTPPEEP